MSINDLLWPTIAIVIIIAVTGKVIEGIVETYFEGKHEMERRYFEMNEPQ